MCPEYHEQTLELAALIDRIESKIKSIPVVPDLSDRVNELSSQLKQKESELEMRQFDCNELLDKLMQAKSEYTSMYFFEFYFLHHAHCMCRREQLTKRIDELNEESEHWRSIGKEADDQLDTLRRDLTDSRQTVSLLEAEKQVHTCELEPNQT